MRKALSSLILAAAPVLVLSACNMPSSGTTPATIPNGSMSSFTQRAANSHVRRPHDTSANDLHAGGATFPAYGYNLGNQPTGSALNGSSPNFAQPPPGTGSLFAAASNHFADGANIYYCLTGSGFGRHTFEAPNLAAPGAATAPCAPLGATATGMGGRVDPVDFAGSDVAMASSDYTTYKTNREPASGTSYGEPFQFPAIGGPIVFGYRPQDFSKSNLHGGRIQLSLWSQCAIANGTITDWNDPAITKDNENKSITGGNSAPLTFYFRSDSSGTSYLFSNYLVHYCQTANFKAPYNAAPYEGGTHGGGTSGVWPYAALTSSSSTWNGPGSATAPNSNFIGENGNPGVLAAVQGTRYGTGYLEGAWAKSANPAVAEAALYAGKTAKGLPIFVEPSAVTLAKAFRGLTVGTIQYGQGSDGVSLGTSRPECALFINPSHFYNTGAGGYPIIGVSYLMFYGHNQGLHTTDKIALVQFLMSKQAAAIESKLQYFALPVGIRTKVTNALTSGGQGNSTPCVN